MANQRKPMFQIKRILQLRVEGKGKRMIARLLGISRTTLQSYLTLFENQFTDLSPLLNGVMKHCTASSNYRRLRMRLTPHSTPGLLPTKRSFPALESVGIPSGWNTARTFRRDFATPISAPVSASGKPGNRWLCI